MDEFELVKRALGEQAEDPAARERARARLEEAIGAGRGSRRPRRRVLGIAAVLVCLVVVALVATSLPPRGPSAAAAELLRLGSIAAAAPGPELGAGDYAFVRSEELVRETRIDLVTGTPYTVLSLLEVDTWIGTDGSGFRRTEVISSGLASPEDRAAWEAADEPDLPTPGEVRSEPFGPREAPWFDLQELPSAPDLLGEILDARQVIRWPPGDDQTFDLIGELLAQGDASPSLRAALFEVAARLDGVELVGETTDPLGRAGVALAVDGIDARTQLVFDAATADLLSIERYPITPDGSVGALESWRAGYPAQIVEAPVFEDQMP